MVICSSLVLTSYLLFGFVAVWFTSLVVMCRSLVLTSYFLWGCAGVWFPSLMGFHIPKQFTFVKQYLSNLVLKDLQHRGSSSSGAPQKTYEDPHYRTSNPQYRMLNITCGAKVSPLAARLKISAGVPKMVRPTYCKKIRPRSTLLHDSSRVAWREHPSSGPGMCPD